MTDRKVPSIKLGSTGSRAPETEDAAFDEGPQRLLDLSDPELFEGILVRRSVAWIIDFAIAFTLASILWLTNCVASFGTLGLVSLPAIFFAPVVLHLGLSTYLLGGARAATLGMRACGVRIVRQDGGRVDHVQAFLMTAMYFATASIFCPVLMAGFFTERSRLLHDLVVGTVAVRTRPS